MEDLRYRQVIGPISLPRVGPDTSFLSKERFKRARLDEQIRSAYAARNTKAMVTEVSECAVEVCGAVAPTGGDSCVIDNPTMDDLVDWDDLFGPNASLKFVTLPFAYPDATAVVEEAKPDENHDKWLVVGFDDNVSLATPHRCRHKRGVLDDAGPHDLGIVPSYVGLPIVAEDYRNVVVAGHAKGNPGICPDVVPVDKAKEAFMACLSTGAIMGNIEPSDYRLGASAELADYDQLLAPGGFKDPPYGVASDDVVVRALKRSAMECDSMRDPLSTAYVTAAPLAGSCCDYPADRKVGSGPRMYISMESLSVSNHTVAFVSCRNRRFQATVNVWRRYNGGRIYVELDSCQRCGVGIMTWPRYTLCSCARSDFKWWRDAAVGAIGLYWFATRLPDELRDTAPFHRVLPMYGSGFDWTPYFVPDCGPALPLVLSMLECHLDLRTKARDLVCHLISRLGGYAEYKMSRTDHDNARPLYACNFQYRKGVIRAESIGDSPGRALASAMVGSLIRWLREQDEKSLALGALFRFAVCGEAIDPLTLPAFLCGFYRNKPPATLEEMCRRKVDPSLVCRMDIKHDECVLVPYNRVAFTITTSMLVAALVSSTMVEPLPGVEEPSLIELD